MAKIGRNQACPCGSGRKYKHCCLDRDRASQARLSPMARMKVSLMDGIATIQALAAEKKEEMRELGVFLFYSDAKGDAWLLEVTDSDAVQVARDGEALELDIDENPETIVINWSHTFVIRDRQLVLTAYEDKAEMTLDRAPVARISAAIRRIFKRYSPEVLNQVHLRDGEQAAG